MHELVIFFDNFLITGSNIVHNFLLDIGASENSMLSILERKLNSSNLFTTFLQRSTQPRIGSMRSLLPIIEV
jgi:hypothetical protein